MSKKELTEDTEREWEAFCKAHYAEYKKKHPPPCIASFWSASAFYNSFENWWDEYKKKFIGVSDKFWAEYGHYVVDWNVPHYQPIVTRPLTEKEIT